MLVINHQGKIPSCFTSVDAMLPPKLDRISVSLKLLQNKLLKKNAGTAL